MPRKHFLQIAHEKMIEEMQAHLWLPGSVAWQYFTSHQSDSTLHKAMRDGYLTKDTGIPALTKKGWRKY